MSVFTYVHIYMYVHVPMCNVCIHIIFLYTSHYQAIFQEFENHNFFTDNSKLENKWVERMYKKKKKT